MSAGDVTWDSGDCFGTPVVEASRLCDSCAGGQILCAEAVRWLARGRRDLAFRDAGRLELKGCPSPVAALEVAWTPPAEVSVLLPAWMGAFSDVSFVGREAERERLLGFWKDADAGQQRFVVLSGEPGIGKTRLAVELAREAVALGGLVFAGRCDEDLAAPYQPFTEILRHLVQHQGDKLRGRLGQLPGELVRLAPELAERVQGLPPRVGSDPNTERWRLFDPAG